MNNGLSRKRAGRLFKWMGSVFAVLAIAVQASLKAQVNEWKKFSAPLGKALETIQEHSWWTIIALLVATPLAIKISTWLARPEQYEIVKASLDEIRNCVFGASAEPGDRVTLFKHESWNITSWPPSWSCLVPIARSGHTHQESSVKFRVPDDADNAEGVAGFVWTRKKSAVIDNLPAITSSSSDEEIEEYAKKTFVSPQRLRTTWPRSRSFYAFSFEVSGKLWGALVIDSRKVGVLGSKNWETQKVNRAMIKVMEKLLRRGSV